MTASEREPERALDEPQQWKQEGGKVVETKCGLSAEADEWRP